ncbi:MAG: hypothetical protein COA42_05860 [Alteromonadaceae bacterium]|nr:MAG: hypothetical protein COA42_05860 [Alteromonadaceae bacterium]
MPDIDATPPYKAAVIGLGAIGLGYDIEEDKHSGKMLTHCHAFHRHTGFELSFGIDPIAENRELLRKHYGYLAYADIAEVNLPHAQVYSLCAPTECHYDVFNTLIKKRPLAIICEKPLATNIEQAKAMVESAKLCGTSLAVNFFRRFEPGTVQLRRLVHQGELGGLVNGTVWYKRGILNNASHFIDLLIDLFGMPKEWGVVGPSKAGDDGQENFALHWQEGSVYFHAVDAVAYNFFEMQLVMTTAMVQYHGGGAQIYIRRTKSRMDFSARQSLDTEGEYIENDYFNYQYYVADHVYRHLRYGTPLLSNGETALKSLKIACDIHDQLYC